MCGVKEEGRIEVRRGKVEQKKMNRPYGKKRERDGIEEPKETTEQPFVLSLHEEVAEEQREGKGRETRKQLLLRAGRPRTHPRRRWQRLRRRYLSLESERRRSSTPSRSGHSNRHRRRRRQLLLRRKRGTSREIQANPDAEVVALSPKTLLATNRFICEVCNKGFQREQNLQLHRRGHNLPWKLKQKNPKEVRRRVYICPEPTCVHHEPSRALGDLTGIKKHYCRKHGEKKWKCDKCSKRYAVQSDWKAHSKTCGTREYRCDCGTLFSRYRFHYMHP
ncbi:Zinc finger protein [Musa troglodytarum]|uniref:Zinc finger protein n=1 Tax=Musa troglodytarum TaxID=320322 RepID=A0A9E7JXT3_9LILI|nr:Zinc finger protein [Musa troglodytarum]